MDELLSDKCWPLFVENVKILPSIYEICGLRNQYWQLLVKKKKTKYDLKYVKYSVMCRFDFLGPNTVLGTYLFFNTL
jgi:hypothetical protein